MSNLALVFSACLLVLAACLPATCDGAAGGSMEAARKAFVEGDYPRALLEYERVLDASRGMGDRRAMTECLIHLGRVCLQMGRYKRALGHLEEAYEMSLAHGYGWYAATSLTVAGKVYRNLGQYEKALEQHRKALTIRSSIDNDKIGEDLLSIGAVYRFLGQYLKSIRYLEKAVEVFRERKVRGFEATALSEIGADYRLMGQPKRALTYHEQALAISRELKNRSQELYDLLYIGIAHLALGELPKAVQYFRHSLGIAEEVQNPKGEGLSLLNLGDTLYRMGKFGRAREAASRSLEIFSELGEREFIWRAESCLGLIDARQGRFEDALVHYEKAIDIIEGLRSGLGEEGRTSYMENRMRVYDHLIGLLMTLHEKDPAKGYDRRSFEIFERKQGRSFLEAMGKSGARHFAWIPGQLRDRESELEEELAECERSLDEEISGTVKERQGKRIRVLENRINGLRTALKGLEEEIGRKFPDYHALKHPKPASIAELQDKVLQRGELLLVYGVLERSTALWVLSREHFELLRVPVGEKELAARVEEFRDGLRAVLEAVQNPRPESVIRNVIRDSSEAMWSKGKGLHRLLIPQALEKMVSRAKTLYIVPSGSLYVLPFETLVQSPATEPEKPVFLVESHPVAYLSSASLLKILREAVIRRREEPRYPLLAFANPVYGANGASTGEGTRSPSSSRELAEPTEEVSEASVRSRTFLELMGGAFAELPETEEEAREIKELLAAPEASHPLQLRAAASRSNVMRMNDSDRLRDYRYLVFSCHGVLPEELDSIRQPSLVLSHPDPQNRQDGFLTMADVFTLRLNADFVSLSACNTGMGQIVRGEGMIGLTRAFMYAGTPALMVNLWSVESQSAKLLNTSFYRHLKGGVGRGEALRRSKLELIQGERGEHLRHPFFWGPSVIFGDAS